MRVSTQIFAAATMLGALSLSAQADTSSRGTLVRGSSLVFYGDLNIDSEQDAKILLQRIERAARKACGGHATFSSYTGSLDHTFTECQSEAVRRTVKSLGSPMVMRVYSEAEARDSRRSTLLKNHLNF